MSRLFLMVLVTAVLVVPAAASAMPTEHVESAPINARGTDVAADFRARGGSDVAAADANARAVEAYYSSYGEPKPIAASEPAPVAGDHPGPSWFGALGIGLGLMLIAAGIGVYAGRSLRPRHLGA